MVYKRKGRPGFTFSARTRHGCEEMGTGADYRPLANKIAQMWERLASEFRAWDLLDPIIAAGRQRTRKLLALYDLYADVGGRIDQLRFRLKDTDLVTLIAPWEQAHRLGVKPDSAAHALAHVQWLFGVEPDQERAPVRMASETDAAWLSRRLSEYEGKRNTLRKVHSSWSMFFAYVTKVHKVYSASPMADVERPKEEASPIRFYELGAVERIVGAQEDDDWRGVFALAYGSAIEVTVALSLTVADVFLAEQEIRAAGTKAHARDRIARVADWAWPHVKKLVAGKLPTARLFPEGWDRWKVSKRHRQTVEALGLKPYPLHCARDHWAVRQIRAGAPLAVVAAQLGHGSPTLTLKKYGRFIPTGLDREKWERLAKLEDQRRAAK